jgi:hypothetical protein
MPGAMLTLRGRVVCERDTVNTLGTRSFSCSVSSGTGSSPVEGEEGGASGSSIGSVRLRVVTLRTISSGEGSRSVAARVSILSPGSSESRSSVALRVDLLVTGWDGNGSWTE